MPPPDVRCVRVITRRCGCACGLQVKDSASAVRVSLFITCFNDTLFPGTGRATVALLERLGCEVEFRAEQTCCGQMHGNSGYEDAARPLAERFGRVFGDAEAVVSPSASCVGFVRDHY